MTPATLKEYLDVLREGRAASAALTDGAFTLNVVFEPTVEALPAGTPASGGWKTVDYLDQPVTPEERMP